MFSERSSGDVRVTMTVFSFITRKRSLNNISSFHDVVSRYPFARISLRVYRSHIATQFSLIHHTKINKYRKTNHWLAAYSFADAIIYRYCEWISGERFLYRIRLLLRVHLIAFLYKVVLPDDK